MSKVLHLKVVDPSGHTRWLQSKVFPWVIGSSVESKDGFRDSTLGQIVLKIESAQDRYWIRVLQEGLVARLGDLQLRDFEVPLQLPIRIGETEITLTPQREKETAAPDLGPWWSVAESGKQLLQQIRSASRTRLSIYLSGETGTGKEVLAQMIHQGSPRVSGPFVPINCGALALSLVESELFGHVKGAFTGALRDRPGALLQAHGGTLFLDEVGDLPLEVQVKLLRFLESGEIRPVGSDRVQHSDVRVVCATHKPLQDLVKEGKFRQDLYYRIASIPLHVPNLRSRPEDIEYLSRRFCKNLEKTPTIEAIRKLKSYSWPGNVRELKHVLERACGLSAFDHPSLQAQDLSFLMNEVEMGVGPEETEIWVRGVPTLQEMERKLILRALQVVQGNRSEAAKMLGVARSTLFEMVKRHGIVGPKTRVPEMSWIS